MTAGPEPAGMVATGSPSAERGRLPQGWFRLLYVACIVGLSLQTMVQTHGLTDHHTWLAGLEIVGALLLLGRQLQRIGLALLLIVYAIAAALIVHQGHLPLFLVLYAGTAIFLVQGGR